ncbi:MAG: LysM peptidoglycan-binding domain-containing protein [Actinomycetaceae bacterium]|nr:LysM peptidoglycan-binding domain-containing protein [Actinomycetaceae bacterium]
MGKKLNLPKEGTQDTAVLLASFKAFTSSLLLSCLAVLVLALIWDSSKAWLNQPVSLSVSTDSPALLLPLLGIFTLLSFYSLWVTVSHLVAATALALHQQGKSVNLAKLAELRILSGGAKAYLQKALITSTLVSSLAFSAASATTADPEELRWGSANTSPTVTNTFTPSTQVLPAASPTATAEPSAPATTSAPASTWQVSPGDCLWSIAKQHLGTEDLYLINNYWHTIWDANREVIGDNPNLIYPGQVLTLPVLQPK